MANLQHGQNVLSWEPYFYLTVPLGSIPELPAVSCKEIKMSEGQAVSGKYWLSSLKSKMAVFAHCDMKTEGKLSC